MHGSKKLVVHQWKESCDYVLGTWAFGVRCFTRVCLLVLRFFCGSLNFSVIMCIALGRLASKCFTCVCQLALVFFGRQNFLF